MLVYTGPAWGVLAHLLPLLRLTLEALLLCKGVIFTVSDPPNVPRQSPRHEPMLGVDYEVDVVPTSFIEAIIIHLVASVSLADMGKVKAPHTLVVTICTSHDRPGKPARSPKSERRTILFAPSQPTTKSPSNH